MLRKRGGRRKKFPTEGIFFSLPGCQPASIPRLKIIRWLKTPRSESPYPDSARPRRGWREGIELPPHHRMATPGPSYSGNSRRLVSVTGVKSGFHDVTVKFDVSGTIGAKFKVGSRRYRRQRTVFSTWNRSVRCFDEVVTAAKSQEDFSTTCTSLL